MVGERIKEIYKLKEKVIRLIEDEVLKEEVLRHAEQYVKENSVEKIAKKFSNLLLSEVKNE